MASGRRPTRTADPSGQANHDPDEPELIDEDDIVDADAEILEADDDIIECLDADDSDETTGELEPVEPQSDHLADVEDERGPDPVEQEEDAPPEPGADPVQSFANHPVRRVETDAYAFGLEDEEPEDVEPTGRIGAPAKPPWEEPPEGAGAVPFEHADEEEEPTGRVKIDFSDETPRADEEPEESPGRAPAGSRSEDQLEADDELTPDDLPGGPKIDLEPVGRRRSRRRPPKPAVRQEFIDEADQTAPESEPEGAEWADEQTEGREPTAISPDPDPGEYPVDGSDRAPAQEGQVRWSKPDESEPPAMPDVGPTRVDLIHSQPQASPLDAKTLIFEDPSAVPAGGIPEDPEVPFLVIVQGEEEGREIELLRDELTMGRGPDNDLVFPDIACSRRHAMLERQGDGWVVVDLGSGNGTLVNGNKAKRELLRDGDEIEVGNTILQFNMPMASQADPDSTYPGAQIGPVAHSTTVTGAAALTDAGRGGFLTQLTADPRRRKLLVIGGGALGGVILLMLIIKLAMPSGPPQPTRDELQRRQEIQNRAKFDEHLGRAKALVQQKNWRDALLEAQAAGKYDPNNMIIRDYVETIQRERSASAALEQAQMSVEQKQWDSAVAALARIPAESQYSEVAAGLKKEIDRQLLDGLLKEALDLLREKQYNQALLKFDEIARRDPDNVEVGPYKRQCEEMIDQVARNQRRNERRNRPQSTRRVRVKAEPKGNVTGQVLALYRNAEIDRAIAKADGSGANESANLLRKFKAANDKGLALAKQTGQADKAIQALQAALKLDKQIAGGSGKYREKLKAMLAKVYYLKGIDSHTRERYPQAYKAYQSALRQDPEHKLTKEKLKELEKIAKKLYEEAYVIKSSDPERAVGQLKIVMQIVPPAHVYYSKAQKLRQRLQGPTGDDSTGSGF
jgi:tetratricopeptide (TPR) repeat protein